MKGIITLEQISDDYIKSKFEDFLKFRWGKKRLTTDKVYTIEGKGKHVAILDYGIKASTLKAFVTRDCKGDSISCLFKL